MKARAVDRRVQRTQQLLRAALMSLIQEKGFESLSVQDIIDRANVGRATFYAHFDGKEDLLASGIEGLRASLRERQRQALAAATGADDRLFAFSHELFVHANEHRTIFRAMIGKRSGAVIQQLLQKMLVDLVRDEVKLTLPSSDAAANSSISRNILFRSASKSCAPPATNSGAVGVLPFRQGRLKTTNFMRACGSGILMLAIG